MAEINLGNKLLDNHIVRFVFSAGLGFLVDNLAFNLLYHNLLVQKTYHIIFFTTRNYTLSLAISYCIGVIVNFIMTKYFVFSQSKSSSLKQLIRFLSVAIIGFFANWAILKIFIKALNMDPRVARPLAGLSLFFASYFIHKAFSFSLALRHQEANEH
ncbi:GtrA family protein [Mucilaginibacter flavidus]|uniref:GtrA family protein n=1 Tax=Mucilaginibacter flavidus TaxID=2949309 RepID=UPI002091FB8D|nr:GtrA family protein [Mucilaginibacter flavidus]MCO5947578.1 GtrA family protein [Mucilaginibacter flavidus]